jgi:hypothetical protein
MLSAETFNPLMKHACGIYLTAPPPIAGSWGEDEEAKLTSVMIPLNLLSITPTAIAKVKTQDLSLAND